MWFVGDFGFDIVEGYELDDPLPDTYHLQLYNLETMSSGGGGSFVNGPGECLNILLSGPQYKNSRNDPLPAGKYEYKGKVVQDYTIQIFGDWSTMIFVDASSLGEDNF